MTDPDPTEADSAAFLGLRLCVLVQIVGAQGRDLLTASKIETPQVCVSVLRFIALNQPTTVTALSSELRLSRQVILQRLKLLEDKALLASVANDDDRRSRLISLTPAGKKEDRAISAILVGIGDAFEDLNREVGANLSQLLSDAADCLSKHGLADRISEMENQLEKPHKKGRR